MTNNLKVPCVCVYVFMYGAYLRNKEECYKCELRLKYIRKTIRLEHLAFRKNIN